MVLGDTSKQWGQPQALEMTARLNTPMQLLPNSHRQVTNTLLKLGLATAQRGLLRDCEHIHLSLGLYACGEAQAVTPITLNDFLCACKSDDGIHWAAWEVLCCERPLRKISKGIAPCRDAFRNYNARWST